MKTAQQKRTSQVATCAVSDTGPLISAFQSDSFAVLAQLFDEVQVPTGCLDELFQHGWQEETRLAASTLVSVRLTTSEIKLAHDLTLDIANHPYSSITEAQVHYGEAEAIILAKRHEHTHHLLLLDELAPRALAKQLGIRLSGFPGALLLAVQCGFLTAEELKYRLEKCRAEGTHYSVNLIQQVYKMAKSGHESL